MWCYSTGDQHSLPGIVRLSLFFPYTKYPRPWLAFCQRFISVGDGAHYIHLSEESLQAVMDKFTLWLDERLVEAEGKVANVSNLLAGKEKGLNHFG